MKVMGIVIIIIGLILVWVGITGDQHNLMAALTGKTTTVPSGQPINPAGSAGTSGITTTGTNTGVQAL